MICANIVTSFQRYEITLPPEYDTLELGYAWLQMKLFTGQPAIVPLQGRMLHIPDPATIQGVEVWEAVNLGEDLPDPLQAAPTPEGPALPVWMDLDTTYLGNHLVLQVIYLELRGQAYALPNQINGQPAFDVLDPGKLGEVTQAALHQAGMGAIIIIPPQIAINSQQAAVEYLIDYAEQATPAAYSPAERTGQAIRGLWDDKQ
jgi:hypothetical protein